MKLGFEIEIENLTQSPQNTPCIEALPDGSLRDGTEFVSTPLPNVKFAHMLYTYMYETLQGTYSERCGFHFHMDFVDRSRDYIVNFLTRYLRLERTLFRVYPHLFRSHNNFCNLLLNSPSELHIIRQYQAGNTSYLSDFSKYSALNIKPLLTLGTIEFRAAPAGLSPADTLTLFKLFESIYYANINPDLLEQVTEEDAAEANAAIQLIYTPPVPTDDSDVGPYMSNHFDLPVTAPMGVPTQASVREFLRGLT